MSANQPEERERKGVSNKVVVIAVVVASLLFALGIWIRSRPDGIDMETPEAAPPVIPGGIQVEIVDGLTGGPIEGATVVIPESGSNHLTGESGKTPVIELPIANDKSFDNILRKSWGEATIIVFKDGYAPYALFHAQIPEGQVRNGPRIYLFPKDSVQSDQPFSVIEGPPRAWVNELVSKYTP